MRFARCSSRHMMTRCFRMTSAILPELIKCSRRRFAVRRAARRRAHRCMCSAALVRLAFCSARSIAASLRALMISSFSAAVGCRHQGKNVCVMRVSESRESAGEVERRKGAGVDSGGVVAARCDESSCMHGQSQERGAASGRTMSAEARGSSLFAMQNSRGGIEYSSASNPMNSARHI